MKEYYVNEYAVITYCVQANNRAEVKQMIEDSKEKVTDPCLSVSWLVDKHTITVKKYDNLPTYSLHEKVKQ